MDRLTIFSSAALAAAALAAPAAAQPVSEAPWSVEGELADGDRQDAEERRYDDHLIRLEAGRRYRLSASSEAFDTLIQLYQDPEPEPVGVDDDGGGGLNSRLTYTPEESGEYRLRVLAFSSEGSGAYAAQVEALPPLPPPVSQAASGLAGTRWHIWEGELTEADPERDGAYFDDYLVPMRAGETRLISVESAEFDAMVWVLRGDAREGEPLELDDDTGPGLNALLGFQAEDDGEHIVRVTAYGSGLGPYRLRISEPLTPPPPAPTDGSSEAPVG
jgi:hypothetical protein